MRRPWIIPSALFALLGLLVWLASARLATEQGASPRSIALAGRVRANELTLAAPRLANGTPAPSGSVSPAVAGAVASVEVSEGQHVEAGQVIARLDDRLLALRVDQARSAARGAWARVGVVDVNLETLEDKAAQLANARRQLDATLRQLRGQRAQVAESLAQAKAAAAAAPPVLPPGVPDPRAAVAKLTAALAQIDQGIAKATAGRARLESGQATVAEARGQLRGARDTLTLVAQAADVGVEVAEARRALSQVRSPAPGVVTFVVQPGTVVFAGGPVARVAPDSPVLLDAYVDSRQARSLAIGDGVEVSADSWPGRSFPARVREIASTYTYPPTSIPTTLVHMTRAFRITVSVEDTHAPLPPGTPVDLTVTTRSSLR